MVHISSHVRTKLTYPTLVADTAFPRSQSLNDLILVIKKYPSLGQEAALTLIDLSQAIFETATPDEVNILIRGTLNQEVYVRNTCLQSLQVAPQR